MKGKSLLSIFIFGFVAFGLIDLRTQAAQGLPGLLQVVLDRWFGKPQLEEGSTRVEAMSRGAEPETLAMPLFRSRVRQTVIAGTRPFRIAWIGGGPPFAVRLNGGVGGTSHDWSAITDHNVSATVTFEEGFYEVRVNDGDGHSVRGAFEVVANPPSVNRSGTDDLPQNVADALLAARLADMDHGAWTLEAYERLRAGPDGPATRVTADRLERGESIAELRTAADRGR